MTKNNASSPFGHKGMSRRDMLAAGAVLPLAQILGNRALAAEAAAETKTVTIKAPSGRDISAAWAAPAASKAPALLLVHEWWGLNDQIKAVATECARLGYGALAIDLYGGKAAANGDAATAKALVSSVKDGEAGETLAAWIDWLRASSGVKGVATLGWCFGGGWSLAASILRPVEATVVYYGRVNRTADELRHLKGPVLGHFANRDPNINHEMVAGFEAAMKEAGQRYEDYWYEADHAFANPTTARYDEADAKLAWSRTLDFLKTHLSPSP
ncbi:MAG TPA: dienelactone hydrolase family protein [Parvibaculum sp.]|jgi:carboxymethylenebutenolidase